MEYANFLIDSCSKSKIEKLDRIQKRSVKIIDRGQHKNVGYDDLLILYGLEDLGARRKKHHLSVMYRHSKNPYNLDSVRPEIKLRNNNKLKFKLKTTQLTNHHPSYLHHVQIF